MSSPPLLSVKDLEVHFDLRRGLWQQKVGTVRAVDGVSFELGEGETLGILGESGSGKTTLGRALLGLCVRTSGEVKLQGRNLLSLPKAELRRARRDIQMIFQDPYASLDPRMNVLEIVAEPLIVQGLARSSTEARAEVVRVCERVGLSPGFLERYPHELSGGQRQRVGVARAIVLSPKLIVADEPVSALDVSIRAQIVNLLASLQKELGIAIVFIAHDLGVVRHLSQRILVMYLGRIVEHASADELFEAPQHPYTRALIASVPAAEPGPAKKRLVLAGEPPSPLDPPKGCAFHTRCPEVMDRCKGERPALKEKTPGHFVACHLDELKDTKG